LAAVYRRKVATLRATLQQEATRAEAGDALKDVIDEIVLTPRDGALAIDLRGDLAGILRLASDSNKPVPHRDGLPVTLVAGTRNQREWPEVRVHYNIQIQV